MSFKQAIAAFAGGLVLALPLFAVEAAPHAGAHFGSFHGGGFSGFHGGFGGFHGMHFGGHHEAF